MTRWYGVRLFFRPGFAALAQRLVLFVLVANYLIYSVTQWITLDPSTLQFDFLQYFRGALAAANHASVYADFERLWGGQAWTVAYIYPPFFALALAPLTPLGLLGAARVWLLAVHGALVAALWLVLKINPELTPTGRRLFLIAAFAFMPVYLMVRFQQVSSVWLLLLAATLWAALRKRDGWAGLFLALAASLKVGPALLLLLFVRLGRPRVAIWGSALLVVITATTMLASVQSWKFFTVVLPRIGLGNANWDNGSVDGLVSRWAAFFPDAFGSATGMVAQGVIAAVGLAVLGITLWQSRASTSDWQLRLSLAAFTTALLIVSSVTWQHHLVTMLLPTAVAMAWIHVRGHSRWFAAGLAAAYALCWLDRRAFPLPADQQVHSAIQAIGVLAGTSVKLAGLLLLWVILLRMLGREHRSALTRPAAAAPEAALPPAA